MKHDRQRIFFLAVLFLFVFSPLVFSQEAHLSDRYLSGMFEFFDSEPTGDRAVAERYALWGRDMGSQGRWNEVLAGMERASDFTNVSSDIPYLLALARHNLNQPRALVLEALDIAFMVSIWSVFSPVEARFFLVENLLAIRAWNDALAELEMVGESSRQAELTLRALSASSPVLFLEHMRETLDRYPRDAGPARVYLEYITALDKADRLPETDELEILEIILRRLPVLISEDPELAWMTAPFIGDTADARRLVLAYRAVNDPVPASIPAALNLGIIDEETALREFFMSGGFPVTALDMNILEEIWDLLRHNDARSFFSRYLTGYSGVIFRDADRDGIPELTAEYRNGMLLSCSYNALQDGFPDLVIFFEAGEPRQALIQLPAEREGRPVADLVWERYPAVLETELQGVRYVPRPFDFFYQPLRHEELWGSGLLFPIRDSLSPPITRRVLVSWALRIERPSQEFRGGIEIIELNQSIPIRAREYVGNILVSETDFLRGRPQSQWLDLNMDGRMDTMRRFSRNYPPAEIYELWDYERLIEFTVSEWDLFDF